jgi:TIR domain
MKDSFISYNQADRQWAEWIAWQLEEAGYSIIIQAWDFRPGGNFILEMDQAAKESERTIAVLSPEFLNSIFTKPEWAAALVKDPIGKDRKLLPVRVKECQRDGLLAVIGYIDLVGLEEDLAKNALLDGVRLERAKPAQVPTFPGMAERIIKAAPRFPEALPPIWNVPFSQNPNFTGREQTLAELYASLFSNQPGAWKQALWGMGGAGKTQIAVEYTYRHKAKYELVWWLRSEEPTTLSADYAALAIDLDLPEKSLKDQSEIGKAVRRWLEHNPGWLLIFDNAQNPTDLQNYFPRGGGGHVIITSRNPEWGSDAKVIGILVFGRQESIDFLLNRTKQRDVVAAGNLAEALGDLPLALEQAAAYISKSGMPFSHYLEMFQKHRKKILELGEPTAYPDTVATAWEISFRKVQKDSPPGADLLKLCSFLAPDEIPKSLLLGGAEHLPETLASAIKDELELEDAISALRSYSLINMVEGSDAFSVHRLVQAVTRDRLSSEVQTRFAGAAVRLIDATFPEDLLDNVDSWAECASLLPHALAVSYVFSSHLSF